MKEQYVNSFLAPAKLVWDKELKQSLDFAKAELVSHQFTTEDITTIIGISGKLEGNVLYGLGVDTAKRIITIMLGEEVKTWNDDLGLSALGELANIITGNAATRLSQLGYPCQISPPVMIEPAGSRFTTNQGPQILVHFTSKVGDLRVRISLKEAQRKD
jgi:chemotaxis protein CheX